MIHLLLMRLFYRNKIRYVTDRKKERDTESTFPYVSGNAFRALCHHIIDDTRIPFYPEHVRDGDLIFLKTKYLRRFIKYMHPQIKQRYFLLTHYGDEDIPGEYPNLLEDKKLIKWFGINVTFTHPKLIPLPIGFGSGKLQKLFDEIKAKPFEKKRLLYLNFAPTHPEREYVRKYFSSKPFCTIHDRLEYKEYLTELRNSQFTISPRGNGWDCHRIWESIFMGTIPILKTSPIDHLFVDLPVLIVENWTEVTEAFLEKKLSEITLKEYNLDKLYMNYWIQLIDQEKRISQQEEAVSSSHH